MPPVPPPSSPVPNAAEAGHPQPLARQQGVPTGTAILLVGLALLIIVGGLGFFYLYNSNRSPSNTTSSITNTQNGEATSLAATSTTQANNATATAQANSVTATVQANNATAQANNANATATANASNTSNTPVSSNYVQLNPYYSGTATGYADGNITFTLKSEDQQGNLSMQTTFQQAANPQNKAYYSCRGSVTTDRNINLECTGDTNQTYLLTIQGYVYSDGHMEGTERATITTDSSYDHLYSWKAY